MIEENSDDQLLKIAEEVEDRCRKDIAPADEPVKELAVAESKSGEDRREQQRIKELEDENKELKAKIEVSDEKHTQKLISEFKFALKHHLMWGIAVYAEVAEGKVEFTEPSLLKIAKVAIPTALANSSDFLLRMTGILVPAILETLRFYKNKDYYKKLIVFNKFPDHSSQEVFYNRLCEIIAESYKEQLSLLTEIGIADFAFFLVNNVIINGIIKFYNEDKNSGFFASFSKEDPRPFEREEAIYCYLAKWSSGKPKHKLEVSNRARAHKENCFAESLITKCGIVDINGVIYKEPKEEYGYRFLLPGENYKPLSVGLRPIQQLPYKGNGFFEEKSLRTEALPTKIHKPTDTAPLLPKEEKQSSCCCLIM